MILTKKTKLVFITNVQLGTQTNTQRYSRSDYMVFSFVFDFPFLVKHLM